MSVQWLEPRILYNHGALSKSTKKPKMWVGISWTLRWVPIRSDDERFTVRSSSLWTRVCFSFNSNTSMAILAGDGVSSTSGENDCYELLTVAAGQVLIIYRSLSQCITDTFSCTWSWVGGKDSLPAETSDDYPYSLSTSVPPLMIRRWMPLISTGSL